MCSHSEIPEKDICVVMACVPASPKSMAGIQESAEDGMG